MALTCTSRMYSSPSPKAKTSGGLPSVLREVNVSTNTQRLAFCPLLTISPIIVPLFEALNAFVTDQVPIMVTTARAKEIHLSNQSWPYRRSRQHRPCQPILPLLLRLRRRALHPGRIPPHRHHQRQHGQEAASRRPKGQHHHLHSALGQVLVLLE